MTYEYTTQTLKWDPKIKNRSPDAQFADLINRVSAYGWRLVTVSEKVAYFEREKSPSE